jgi:hypothetical protein
MSFLAVWQRVTAALDHAGIAYMLTGSFASVYYGSPRSTQDIDLVIASNPAQLRAFIEGLPAANIMRTRMPRSKRTSANLCSTSST